MMPTSVTHQSYCNIIPKHIAIVMDGNGRWAQERGEPRLSGHNAGVKALRECVKSCIALGVRYLTAFAFSSENWRRPTEEVQGIMQLFIAALQTEAQELKAQSVELKFIGDKSQLSSSVLEAMSAVEGVVVESPRLSLIIAMNYGGRWDIIQAANKLILEKQDINEDSLQKALTTSEYSPEPDLIIRTGGELRISNFLLWQAAYAELFFTPTLWPDFSQKDLEDAIQSFSKRERRFGAVINK